uniref:WKF domain-containing protein n=1 Tax=Mola mola TaxID=94237 RepID=A0A3Q3W304_MOLML
TWPVHEQHEQQADAASREQYKLRHTYDPPCGPEVAHEPEENLSPDERRVLERKMKKILRKEEKRLKAEGETLVIKEASGPTAPQQALDYLTCWAENRTEWKFQKTRQTWLLQHIFDFEKIPDEKFPVLLQYLEGLRGGARNITVQKALVLVEESGQAPEDRAVQQRAHRAREVIQLLS